MAKENSLSKEIEDIIVDCYDDSEVMGAWGVTFEDGVVVPFLATLLGVPIEVTGFRASDQDVLQCPVVLQGRKRWVALEDLDEKGLPADMAHLLHLYHSWTSGDY